MILGKRAMAEDEYRRLTCGVVGCDRPHKARGYCMTHYVLQRRKVAGGEIRRVSAYFAGWCVDCGAAIGSRRRQRRCSACDAAMARRANADKARDKARKRHADEARETTCASCGAVFCPLYGHSVASMCMPCADAKKASAKRAQRVRRKALQRGAQVETVDPIKVFERDRWRCHLCHGRTPANKRGSYHDDAPELDHIVPLAAGGSHSYVNTACACRRCNGLKNAKPLGQMRLFG